MRPARSSPARSTARLEESEAHSPSSVARIKATIEQFSQWLPHKAQTALLAGYEYVPHFHMMDCVLTNQFVGFLSFTPLSYHLANLAALAMADSAPIIPISRLAKGEKRKPPAASRGVESLKKVNTTSMSKLTSFFKAKDGLRGK